MSIKQILTILLLAGALTACGKKPSALLVPSVQDHPKQIYPQAYPKPQQPPPVS